MLTTSTTESTAQTTPQTQPSAATQAVTPEIPSAKTPTPEEINSRFAALAKRDRLVRLQAQKAKQLEAQIVDRERQIAERERKLSERDSEWDQEFKLSPLEALKKRGYSYADLTKAALNDGKFHPDVELREVRSEIEKLRQDQADKEKKAQESQTLSQQKAEQEAVENFKLGITDFLQKNNEKYELTALYDADDFVFQTIEEHYLRSKEAGNPKVLSIDEACELVESYLEKEIERTAQKSKKFQSKYMAPKQAEPQKPKSTTTLTNDMIPSSAVPSLLSPKNEQDRLKRALAALG